MKLYNKINKDLRNSIKNRKKINTSVLRVLISDIQRKSDKDYNDDYVIKIINKTLKFLSENNNNNIHNTEEREILEHYLPNQISDNDIILYLKEIGAEKTKSMSVIGKVMKHFPSGSVKGKRVKDIIINLNN